MVPLGPTVHSLALLLGTMPQCFAFMLCAGQVLPMAFPGTNIDDEAELTDSYAAVIVGIPYCLDGPQGIHV